MRAYQLHVQSDGAWSWVCTIDAPTHAEAFEQALLCLSREEMARPIRIEQDTEGAYRKPPPRRRRAGTAAKRPVAQPMAGRDGL